MDLFSLVARLSLDRSDYESGVDDARGAFSKLGEGIKSGLKTAAKVGAAALGAAATGVAALTKSSVEQYAQYEQLVGGVETLFGQASRQVMKYAEMAYKTSGLSANEYMETVTSFSASLLQSLGGDTYMAAHLADMAVKDMSDNANKMGSDISSIQTAYQGFSRGQFQLLDNLKLGYGGTKEEMQRLLDDAEKLSGVKYDISSYADIVKAIHVVQDEMGITGTTAKEASKTISGSISTLKAAWTNLVTGLGDENANFNELINNVVDSAITAGENLIPRIEQVLLGIGTLVQKLAPVIAKEFPGLVKKVLPPILSAASSLLEAVVKALPTLARVVIDALPGIIEMLTSTLADMAPELIELAIMLMTALADGLVAAIPTLVEKAPEIITSILNALIENVPKLLEAGLQAIVTLAKGIADALPELIPTIVDVVLKIADILTDPDNLSEIIDAAAEIMLALIDGIVEALPKLIEKGPEIIKNIATGIVDNLPKIIEAGLEVIVTLADGIADALPELIPTIVDVVLKIADILTEPDNLSEIIDAAIEIMLALIDGIVDSLPKLVEKGPEIIENIVTGIVDNFPKILEAGGQIIGELAQGILDNLTEIGDAISDVGQTIIDGIGSLIDSAAQWGRDMIDNFIGGINGMWESAKKAVSGFAGGIKKFLGFSEPEEGPLSDFHTYAPDMMELFAKGIRENQGIVEDAIAGAFNFRPAIAGAFNFRSDAAGGAGEEIEVPRAEGAGAQRSININMYIDGREYARAVLPFIEAEQQRVGVRLTGGSY